MRSNAQVRGEHIKPCGAFNRLRLADLLSLLIEHRALVLGGRCHGEGRRGPLSGGVEHSTDGNTLSISEGVFLIKIAVGYPGLHCRFRARLQHVHGECLTCQRIRIRLAGAIPHALYCALIRPGIPARQKTIQGEHGTLVVGVQSYPGCGTTSQYRCSIAALDSEFKEQVVLTKAFSALWGEDLQRNDVLVLCPIHHIIAVFHRAQPDGDRGDTRIIKLRDGQVCDPSSAAVLEQEALLQQARHGHAFGHCQLFDPAVPHRISQLCSGICDRQVSSDDLSVQVQCDWGRDGHSVGRHIFQRLNHRAVRRRVQGGLQGAVISGRAVCRHRGHHRQPADGTLIILHSGVGALFVAVFAEAVFVLVLFTEHDFYVGDGRVAGRDLFIIIQGVVLRSAHALEPIARFQYISQADRIYRPGSASEFDCLKGATRKLVLLADILVRV